MAGPEKIVRIGGASGFWGDSSVGAPQLVNSGQIDYLVFDYLAETTMAILAAARLKNPALGYATDFVEVAMRAVLPEVMRSGIKVVANAGGIHPRACAEALRVLAEGLGLSPRIAVVEGDDISALLPQLRAEAAAPFPEQVLSVNAYLGALPIARALAAGADIVITGRVVDSAVTLGPLMHEFGWSPGDFDRLAGGSLGGHIIECGCQATGGLHTDWQSIPDWAHIGYPIIDCRADGSFLVTKPAGTGGAILRAAVAEQLLYEIGDPRSYRLPDVICDFSAVQIEQVDALHVRVSGARGRAPTASYKVSGTAQAGYRCTGSMVIIGIDAAAKAQRTGEAILERCRGLLQEAGLGDFSAAEITLFGAETLYGAHARTAGSREVMLRVSASHLLKRALEIFAREIAPSGTSWAPGTTGPGSGRPSVSPRVRAFSFLVDKVRVPMRITMGEWTEPVTLPPPRAADAAPTAPALPPAWVAGDGDCVEVPLIRLAWARSGDKGDVSNIGIIARRPEWLPLLWAQLTPERVAHHFAHLVKGQVERHFLPGIAAINFVMHEALDGGGPGSNRMDPLGKGMAQILLEMPVRVPADAG